MLDTYPDVITTSAALAPSVHNTQPWRIAAQADVVEILADRSRQLPFLDPTGRQLHLSCGAAVEFPVLAARACGRACDVAMLPDPSEPDLLARLTLGAVLPPTRLETRLADAVAVRCTDRGPYDDRPVPPEIQRDAEQRAAGTGAWLRRIERVDERRVVVSALSAAERLEAADPRYAEELSRWTHADHGDVGMPASAVAGDWPDGRVSDVPLRDFSGGNHHPRPGRSRPPTVERDFLLLLCTALDDREAWLSAGRLLGWLLLRATAEQVSAQPLAQAIDLPSARTELAHGLDLLGHPQFLLRLGYGTGRPTTRRRTGTAAQLQEALPAR